jgi:hypothetical protein
MATEYNIDAELQNLIDDMTGNVGYREFNELRKHDIGIVGLLVTKTDTNGDSVPAKGDPVKIVKISPAIKPLVRNGAQYAMYVNNYEWTCQEGLATREVLVHRALMGIDVQEVKGKIKLGKRKPDINEFSATIMRFGAYSNDLLGIKEMLLKGAQKVAAAIGGGKENDG